MEAYILTLDNIHCQSCVDSINKVLAPLLPEPTADFVFVNIPERTVTVAVERRNEDVRSRIVDALYNAGFDVMMVDAQSLDPPSGNFFSRWIGQQKQQKKHREHCTSCQKNKKLFRKTTHDSDSDGGTASGDETLQEVKVFLPDEQPTLYRTVFSIGGMTCAACQNSITVAIEEKLPEVDEFALNVMTKSGVAIVSDKRLVNKIQEIVTETGYDCEIIEVIPIGSSSSKETERVQVSASIGGMTCSSCVNAILAQVQQLPFVYESSIDLMGHSGLFVIDSTKDNIAKLKEAVENAGYDFEVANVKPTMAVKSKSRTVNLAVSGMFCG